MKRCEAYGDGSRLDPTLEPNSCKREKRVIFVSKRLPLSTESLLNWYLEASIQTTFTTYELVPFYATMVVAKPIRHARRAVSAWRCDRLNPRSCRDVDCNRDPVSAAFYRSCLHRHAVAWFLSNAYLSRQLLRRVVARSPVRPYVRAISVL